MLAFPIGAAQSFFVTAVTAERSLPGRAQRKASAVLRRVGITRWRPESSLLVPVPPASALVRRALGERGAPRSGLPPHVTLVYPFVPPAMIDDSVESMLEEIAARFPPFGFRLASVARFPGVLYLRPEPAAPFLDLTEAVVERWPNHRPYGRRASTVVPHVTVVVGPEPPGVAAALEQALPVECSVDHLDLVVQDDRGRWRIRRRLFLPGERGGALTRNPAPVNGGIRRRPASPGLSSGSSAPVSG